MKKRIKQQELFILTLLFYFCTFLVSFESTTATAQSYLPTPGDWFGNISQGKPVRFVVNDSSTHINYFFLTYVKDCGSITVTETWAFISLGEGFEIINNQFLLSSPGRAFTGKFTSDETSTGKFKMGMLTLRLKACGQQEMLSTGGSDFLMGLRHPS